MKEFIKEAMVAVQTFKVQLIMIIKYINITLLVKGNTVT